MNATGTQRSLARSELDWAPPEELTADAPTGAEALSYEVAGSKLRPRGLPVRVAYGVIDAATVCFIGALAYWVRFGVGHPFGPRGSLFGQVKAHPYIGFFLVYAALVVLGCASQDLYRTLRERRFLDESWMVAKAVSLATGLLVLFIFTSGTKEVSRLVVVSAGVMNVASLSGWRYFKRRMVVRRTMEGVGVRRALIVGAGRTGRALARWFEENRQLGYAVCGFLDARLSADQQILGTFNDLRRVALAHFADELFITVPSERELVKKLVGEARRLRLGLKVIPELYDGLGWRTSVHMMGGFPVMELHGEPIPRMGLAVKRMLDVVIAGAGLFVTAPLLAVLALLIRINSPGPAIYAAQRVGRKGNKFRCFKLRTMIADADAQKGPLRETNERDGPFFKMEDDPRVTRCGRWLRKLSLDELPQLWNVLRGEMSLVGPRPHPLDDYERYTVENLRRLDVKPGITGLWQVTARRDPSFETSMALDLEYIENWSLWLDLRILLKTLPEVLRASGR
ncbi:MAG: sugar transferase [Acidobacteria bacterium]|nr:MAG: hypothetical protein AUH86_08460 [Acidobacteria bacterium 13_1_40CM_4_58_4]PYT59037.1 MAG: sugar transferase [Acidobacteriota bacterium]